MYGVVEISGHQYKVGAGAVIDVQKLPEGDPPDAILEFDRVYFISGPPPQIGCPTVPGARVKAQVLRHGRSPKVRVLRKRAGSFQKKKGHRQPYTSLLITEIDNGQGQVEKMEAEDKEESHGP